MRIHIATDHAAFELKQFLVTELTALGYDVVDHGAYRYDPDDDYPVFVIPAAEAVAAEPGSLGIVLGGSGNGEQIAANKVRGVRAARVTEPWSARMAREHNDANVLCLGERVTGAGLAEETLLAFRAGVFAGGRHAGRVAKLEP